MKKSYRTDFLFVNPSFLMGIGSVLNIAGNYYSFNYAASDIAADRKAIEADWGVVGQDIVESADKIKISILDDLKK